MRACVRACVRRWRKQILDDKPWGTQFKRGYVSFAGGGPNTRTTQLFIAYVDSERNWGKSPW